MTFLPTFIKRQINYLKNRELEPVFLLSWFPISVPFVLAIRLIRPWILIRFSDIFAHSMGVSIFVSELYLCREDIRAKKQEKKLKYDFFYMDKKIANKYLICKFKCILCPIFNYPYLFFKSVEWVNNKIPFGEVNSIDCKDIARESFLLDLTQNHIQFTADELKRGEAELERIGVPVGSKFVCLLVRDNAYMESYKKNYDDSGNNYRNCNIDNYVLAAEELVNRGYYVIRMGAKVSKPFKSKKKRVIDYAFAGLRSEFMDVYLGSKCEFCITTGCGWDAVPSHLFRKPIVYTNLVPLGIQATYSDRYLLMTRRHFDIKKNRELSLKEIVERGFVFCHSEGSKAYETQGIKLIENSQEEIRDVVIEMVERLEGTWKSFPEEETLQKRFWEIFPSQAISSLDSKPMFTPIKARFSADYLYNNKTWLVD